MYSDAVLDHHILWQAELCFHDTISWLVPTRCRAAVDCVRTTGGKFFCRWLGPWGCDHLFFQVIRARGIRPPAFLLVMRTRELQNGSFVLMFNLLKSNAASKVLGFELESVYIYTRFLKVQRGSTRLNKALYIYKAPQSLTRLYEAQQS